MLLFVDILSTNLLWYLPPMVLYLPQALTTINVLNKIGSKTPLSYKKGSYLRAFFVILSNIVLYNYFAAPSAYLLSPADFLSSDVLAASLSLITM